jgi:hypothetical protein
VVGLGFLDINKIALEILANGSGKILSAPRCPFAKEYFYSLMRDAIIYNLHKEGLPGFKKV